MYNGHKRVLLCDCVMHLARTNQSKRTKYRIFINNNGTLSHIICLRCGKITPIDIKLSLIEPLKVILKREQK